MFAGTVQCMAIDARALQLLSPNPVSLRMVLSEGTDGWELHCSNVVCI